MAEERLSKATEELAKLATQVQLDKDERHKDRNLLRVLLATGITEDLSQAVGLQAAKASPEQMKKAIKKLGLD